MALVAKQPTEIFICNTSNIDSMRHGRPQTVMLKEANIPNALQGELPNGPIVALVGTQETSDYSKPGNILDHVNSVTIGCADGKAAEKFIVVSPEIRVEQYRRIDNSIAGHMLVANETYTAYELQLRDRIEYSLDYFADEDIREALSNPVTAQGLVGTATLFNMNEQGKLEKDGAALRIVSVREQSKPLMYAPHAQGKEAALMHAPVIMVKLEVIA